MRRQMRERHSVRWKFSKRPRVRRTLLPGRCYQLVRHHFTKLTGHLLRMKSRKDGCATHEKNPSLSAGFRPTMTSICGSGMRARMKWMAICMAMRCSMIWLPMPLIKSVSPAWWTGLLAGLLTMGMCFRTSMARQPAGVTGHQRVSMATPIGTRNATETRPRSFPTSAWHIT